MGNAERGDEFMNTKQSVGPPSSRDTPASNFDASVNNFNPLERIFHFGSESFSETFPLPRNCTTLLYLNEICITDGHT